MTQPRPSLDDLTRQLIEFRDVRDWRQFHSLKDLILSLNLEAGELLELAQWRPEKDCLLYTSPSPRDQRGSRMPSSA